MGVCSRLAPIRGTHIRGAVSVVDLRGTVEEHDIIITSSSLSAESTRAMVSLHRGNMKYMYHFLCCTYRYSGRSHGHCSLEIRDSLGLGSRCGVLHLHEGVAICLDLTLPPGLL